MKNEKAYLKRVMNNSMEEDVYYQRTGKVNKLSKNKKASPKKDKFKRGSFDESDYGDDFRRGRK
jgi:hypothetical protein